VTDDAGCTATEVITLNPPSGADDASFDFADFCEGAPNGPTNIATPGGTFSFNPLPTDNATIDPLTGEIFSGVPGTTYFVEYTTFGNCPSTSTESVTVFFVPIADFHVEPNEGVPPLEVEIDNNSSSNIVSSLWNFGDGNIEVNNNEFLSYTYTDAGQYTLVLTVESEDGCTNFISKEINVFHSDIEWKFPNVFTPNGDGQNDFFKLVGHLNVHEFEIIVLNRWGNTVFESNSVEFNWNGKVNNSGADCIDGTYFYKARLMNYNGDEEEVHGFVHLARNK
ncbi:MAG: gliding motility-associated C-terminal domain-containing protein, partial [Balneolaceae bacterium]